ncbi:MAG: ATP-dependent protease subunit HslV [Myxococcota bacterium]|nr:ATP-dependent protease subunit HslV [Myxococcota bacterium]
MMHATTIIAVKRNGRTVIGGDGQVTMGQMVVKHGATKIRRIAEGRVIVGFAGSTADAMTLFEKLDAKLSQFNGNLTRAAVELAKDWRTDKYLRRLEAMMLAADRHSLLMLSGTGDVLAPDEGIVSIGSGSPFALAAAKALAQHTELSAMEIAQRAMEIASQLCIYTNTNFSFEELVESP